MTTTQTPRLAIDAIEREGFLWEDVDLGSGAVGFTSAVFESVNDWPDEVFNQAASAWEKEVVNPAIREVMPQIRNLLADAIERRLPWEWQPK